MANLRAVRALCDTYDVPLWLDAARFAENAWLIRRREPGYADRTPREIAQEMFALADGVLLSAKKDALSHAGGFIALRDGDLARRCRSLLIATEGYSTYGGMTGRDMEITVQGLQEGLEPDYLRSREDDMRYLARQLAAVGVPTVAPTAMHGVYVDAAAVLPHLTPAQYPGQALACELYLEGGIRSCEIGSVFGGTHDAQHQLITPAPRELLRLAFPRRLYTRDHMDHVVQTFAALVDRADSIPGCRIIDAPPELAHFEAQFARLS
jgi:tryptophanase